MFLGYLSGKALKSETSSPMGASLYLDSRPGLALDAEMKMSRWMAAITAIAFSLVVCQTAFRFPFG